MFSQTTINTDIVTFKKWTHT